MLGRGILRTVLRVIVPGRVRRAAHARVDGMRRWIKTPRMIWGYRCQDGGWRPRTRISDTVAIYRPDRVRIGDNVFVGHYCILDGTGGIEIGEGVHLAASAGVFTHSSHTAIRLYGRHYTEVPEEEKVALHVAPVRIGAFAYIGAGAKILSGVSIGTGSVVGAGCIVRKDVEPYTVVAGNPAREVGSVLESDLSHLDDPQLRAWYDEWRRPDGIPSRARK
jgi:acetyltransferase-like isoleucine patch superfamily enzyme